KKKKGKSKKGSLPDVAILLKKFMKTYEKHCAQAQSSVSPTIKQGLQKCIEREEPFRRIILTCPEVVSEVSPPAHFKPLLMTIRDERYMLGKELCIWNIPLNNQDIADLSIVLELRGRTVYPFSKLELMDCAIDVWSVERLGKATSFSNLTIIVLDY
uniref:Uncharacterized protein n=1 Tax=Latimeria chalumnae TaxID=7897 RepID=H2ZXJ8_LATCH